MKRSLNTLKKLSAISLLSVIFTGYSMHASAATVALANAPLASTNTTSVKPNVMFTLDDSGSMGWDYLPDWANDNNPLPAPNVGSGTAYTNTPLFHRNSEFNGVAYNPEITYLKPVHFDATGLLNTTTYPNQVSPWTAVRVDGYNIQSTGTINLVGNANYYLWGFAEYCTNLRMTNCVAATAPVTISGVYYGVPAKLRWCTNGNLNTCQSINSASYTFPRYPGAVIPAVGSTATITITGAGQVTGITVNGKQIMSGSTTSSTNTGTVASRVVTNINNCTGAITGACTIAGYSATRSGNIITISAPASLGAITFTPTVTGNTTQTITAFSGGQAASTVPGTTYNINIVSTNNSYPYPGSTTKASSRIDCAGTTCTYAEEMNNYANWYAYYHTRMQAMKTAVSRAFMNISKNFRVGFNVISYTGATNGNTFLGNDTFELTYKNNWYNHLFATAPTSSTPLRGALSKIGRYYAKKISGQVDPIQYSCQQNFMILSTDGYWNTGLETSTYGAINVTGGSIGNQDAAASTSRPMREGTTAVSNTLADIAKYYYETDLRTTTFGNCAGGTSTDYPTGNPDVCYNNVFVSPADNNPQQHMTTFTMGLGADGTLVYQSDYDTATSGDFYDLKKGLGTPTVNWPDPIANSTQERIDDLWHAAVNGRGLYFSARSPEDIINGLTRTLTAITAKLGAAAAAATSTLNPVPGNNFSYVASYTTVSWKGNLESRSVNTTTGVVSKNANWCVEDITASTCIAPSTITTDTSGSSTVYNCVTPFATTTTCPSPGVFDAIAQTCTTQIANACTGSLKSTVAAYTDTRTIKTANDTGDALINFDDSYAIAHPGYFDAARIGTMNQWGVLTTTQRTAAEGVNLIRFLRGQNGFEDRLVNPASDRLYRAREAVLGDALESQPAFVGKPLFPYVYSGYTEFKNLHATRAGTVYMGTNDGMLHAFNADTGAERWAYVPSMVIPNMWKLADNIYSTNHVNYINGSVNTSDVCVSGCDTVSTAVWKTILVGGLNGGGRGYYALDITDPANPALMWEFTTTAGIGIAKDDDLGYTFGNPIVTRRSSDGKWVVVVTSGYNNVSPGSGVGYLFVLDAGTGAILSKISTGVGSTVTPGGLAKIAGWNEEPGGSSTKYVYGGDLQGNVWKFNISDIVTNATIGKGSVFKFATLFSDNAGTQPQAMMTSPILADIDGYRVVIIGTGKYLEASDLSNTQTQSLYAIKDDGSSTTFVNPRSTTHTGSDTMMVQTIIDNPNGTATRIHTNPNDVTYSSQRGWYLDFPDHALGNNASERVALDGKLIEGTLVIATIVPSNTVCRPGGYSWLSYFNYRNGQAVGTLPDGSKNINVSSKYDSPIVGINVIYIGGKPITEVVTAADPTPEVVKDLTFGSSASGFASQRVIWREVFQ